MDTFEAVGLAEGFQPARDEEHLLEAWQHLVTTGVVWSLQGWFGRRAMELLEAGEITAPGEWGRAKA